MSSHRRMADELSRMAAQFQSRPFPMPPQTQTQTQPEHNRAGDAFTSASTPLSTSTPTSTSTSTRQPSSRSNSAATWSFMGSNSQGGRWVSESHSESWVNGQRHTTHKRRDLNVRVFRLSISTFHQASSIFRLLCPASSRVANRNRSNSISVGRGACDAHVPGRDDALLCQRGRTAARAARHRHRQLGGTSQPGQQQQQRSTTLEPPAAWRIKQMMSFGTPVPPRTRTHPPPSPDLPGLGRRKTRSRACF